MDELMQKLSGYLDAAESVLTEYGPQAMDAALFVVRFDAVFCLVAGFMFAALCYVGIRYGKALCVPENTQRNPIYTHIEVTEFKPKYIVGVLAYFGAFVAFVVATSQLLSPYLWLAAFDPMLGLVYKAASSAGLL